MKKVQYALLLVLIPVFYLSCKKDIGDPDPVNPPAVTDTAKRYTTQDVQILLPSDATIDLASLTISSLSVESKVDAQGKVKAAYNQGLPSIAYVFDKENNLLLAGFLTDTTRTISIGSTAEVLLYFSMGTVLQPNELMHKFISGIAQVPGVADFKGELETLFKSDPRMLQKGLFASVLKNRTEAIIKTGVIPGRINSFGRSAKTSDQPADITVRRNIRQ